MKSIEQDVFGFNGDEIIAYLENVRGRSQHVQIYSFEAEPEEGKVKLDLTGKALTEFTYHSPLEFDVKVSGPESETCAGSFVVEAKKATNVTIFGLEQYGTSGACKLVGPASVNYKVCARHLTSPLHMPSHLPVR